MRHLKVPPVDLGQLMSIAEIKDRYRPLCAQIKEALDRDGTRIFMVGMSDVVFKDFLEYFSDDV